MISTAPQTIDDVSRIILQFEAAKSFTFRVGAALGRELGKIIFQGSEAKNALESFAIIGENMVDCIREISSSRISYFVVNISSCGHMSEGKDTSLYSRISIIVSNVSLLRC